jgi:hypothetical protein
MSNLLFYTKYDKIRLCIDYILYKQHIVNFTFLMSTSDFEIKQENNFPSETKNFFLLTIVLFQNNFNVLIYIKYEKFRFLC